jgi:hypothetical protein
MPSIKLLADTSISGVHAPSGTIIGVDDATSRALIACGKGELFTPPQKSAPATETASAAPAATPATQTVAETAAVPPVSK